MTETELQIFLAPKQDDQSNLNLPSHEESQLQRHLIGKQTRQRYIAEFKKKILK